MYSRQEKGILKSSRVISGENMQIYLRIVTIKFLIKKMRCYKEESISVFLCSLHSGLAMKVLAVFVLALAAFVGMYQNNVLIENS